jgi:hypothetical protein
MLVGSRQRSNIKDDGRLDGLGLLNRTERTIDRRCRCVL